MFDCLKKACERQRLSFCSHNHSIADSDPSGGLSITISLSANLNPSGGWKTIDPPPRPPDYSRNSCKSPPQGEYDRSFTSIPEKFFTRRQLTNFLEAAENLGYTADVGLQLLTSLQTVAAWGGVA